MRFGPREGNALRTGNTGVVPDLPDHEPAAPDPNDSRTWPRWMTLSVLLTGIIGVLVTIALTLG